MTRQGKDSEEVIRFMRLFSRLKDWSDNTPNDLVKFATSDGSIKQLCMELHFAAHILKERARHGKKSYAAPVDPSFLAAWREYEKSYEEAVTEIFFLDIDFLFDTIDSGKTFERKSDQAWFFADYESSNLAKSLDAAIEFARYNADQDERWDDEQSDFIQSIQEGVSAWSRLKQDTSFDLRGIFRRRELIPFVLIPRNIARNHGNDDKLSMMKNLKQAHDAFIYGAIYAALALMRSIMEAVLRDHYHAEGRDLNERIQSARGRLPPAANEAALHRLRKLANAVLHLDAAANTEFQEIDDLKIEKETILLLFVLRALIEGAKT